MTKIFNIWRFVIQLGFAKSGLWTMTSNREFRTMLFSIHIVEDDNKNKALSIIIGPFSLITGFV